MTVQEALLTALRKRDAKAVGDVVDFLRNRRFHYDSILKLAQSIDPNLTRAEWDAMLYESDCLESGEDING